MGNITTASGHQLESSAAFSSFKRWLDEVESHYSWAKAIGISHFMEHQESLN